jgi:2-polyprenyl-6-methoxyphenol hydroxylase-like FAD-dependent oxidoreductase
LREREPGPDVTVVGAGLAGAAAAAALGHAGIRVALVDPWPDCPPCFKAEKIEPDQAQLLRELGLLDRLKPRLTRIHAIASAHGGRVLNVRGIEQYGVFYRDLVNGLRQILPSTVCRVTGRVAAVSTSPRRQSVTLADGRRIGSRLVVIATGTGPRLGAMLGVPQRTLSPRHSVSFGFTIARHDGGDFPFDALTYYADRLDSRIDYLTLFPIGNRMRANLFAYRRPADPWVRSAVANPEAVLAASLPGLSQLTGRFQVEGSVEVASISLSVADLARQEPGVVLIGDACQTVCPATGSGVSKALTDVAVLRALAAAWLATPGMPAQKIAGFYADSRKRACDRASLQAASYRRLVSTDSSWRWRVHRRRVYFRERLRGVLDRLAP